MPKYTCSVCVFCGSRPGTAPGYVAAAQETGRMLAANGWRLVYGAGDVGLMGEVARATQGAGGETFGVIPVHLLGMEVGKRDLSTFVVTETMHERKKVMYMNSDAFVVLPGGAGTLDELFEIVTWRQIGLHDKPVFVVNTEGYWDPLIAMFDAVVAGGFAAPSLRDFITPVADIPALRAALAAALPAPATT
ncbi:TIGR00730 family Rossman fold protein [Frigidibacter sp. MR17.24]|uniref:LOG family protein n=1 Tax=Frigidibacter sp. MR17.24 TaxID=3127345 RepID=UPI003012DEF3